MLDEVNKDVSDMMVKVLMRSISCNSRKHAELFKALVEMINGLSKPLTDEEYIRLEKSITKHIEIESAMITTVNTLIDKIEDERLKSVLRYILDDERRHHALLIGLQEVVTKREIVTEHDWLEVAWKDIPFFF